MLTILCIYSLFDHSMHYKYDSKNQYIWCMIAPFEITEVRHFLDQGKPHSHISWMTYNWETIKENKKGLLLAHWCEYLKRSWTLFQFYLLLWITYFFCYAKLPTCDFQRALSFAVLLEPQLNMRKFAPERVSYWDDFFISYRVYLTGSFHISLLEGTLHVDKIHVRFKIANITHALFVPVYLQTDFTPKRLVVSRLHDTVAKFRTGVKFSPRYNNRGELTPGWVAPAWNFVVVSCKQM